MSWSLDGRPLGAILVSRLRYLGDVAMSTVVLDALRRGDPGLRLGYLCESAAAPLLAGDPRLQRLHVLARGGREAAARPVAAGDGRGGRSTAAVIADLRRARYDLSVDLFANPRSAVLLRLAGARARIGGGRGWRRRLATHPVDVPPAARDPEFRAAAPGGLGELLGRLLPLTHGPSGLPFRDWYLREYPRGLPPRLHAAPSPLAAAALASLGAGAGRPYLLLAPGATWPAKAWPRASWDELRVRLAGADPRPVVELSAPGDGPGSGAWPDGSPGGRLPPLGLADALAVVAGADAVVAVDGGIAHAAVACGRPTLALFGPTDPAIWFPYEGFGPYRVLCTRPACHPCDRHVCPESEFVCLPGLSPATVAAELASLGGRGAGR
ncbi:MAG: glycosyltransferase family 9 protein [bacterium]|nr:glycosyltransferase family 9 protein [bacterium]